MLDRFAQLMILMGAAHVICDFPLQGHLSKAKRPGGDPGLPWQMALAGHGLVHGGAVALITGIWWLGAAELLAHCAIDFGKCRLWYGMKVDQVAHFACKIAWAALAVRALT
jgi:hypothetical protein